MRAALAIFALSLTVPSLAQPDAAAPEEVAPETIADRTGELDTREGFLDLHLDHDAGTIWLTLPAPDPETGHIETCIYVESLAAGLGSNPVGLDRGQLGPSRLVSIREVGGKVLVEQHNTGFRAATDNPDERRAVRDSFASSVLWAGPVELRDPEDGSLLVDITSFVVRDSHRVVSTLKRTGQGSFSMDASRSAPDTRATLAFPDNVELEALVTFSSSEPGRHVRQTAPDATSVTLRVHHSFIRLPDDGYRPRAFDPRIASFAISFLDYAAPLDGALETRWIMRHRLERADPSAERSEAVEPIVYYVDRGAPEPVRSALIEGASWWNQAFTAAGFDDAFRVEVMPEDAHPLDVRYNVIQWVHRSTRGWSYGGSIYDPRTGEILKGHVSLGSLRVRQDRRIFEALSGVDGTGSGAPDDPVQLALARIRQLSAHEVGHTIGFAHNFAASTYAGRASVMDYPAPWVRAENGRLAFGQVYDIGIGEWDTHCVRYAYTEFDPEDEADGLAAIVQEGLDAGYAFISDADARPPGAAHPDAALWDNGSDLVAELANVSEVRRIAMESFGTGNLPEGAPVDQLHETFVPLYLYHRYQVEAACKSIGGLRYTYSVVGDGQPPTRFVEPETQRAALDAVLTTIEPGYLDIPEPVLALLAPRSFGNPVNRELFASNTSPAFDALGAASAAADLTLGFVLDPARLSRLYDQHRRDPEVPSVNEVMRRVADLAMEGGDDLREREIRRRIQSVLVQRLIHVAQHSGADPAVRARANAHLRDLRSRLLASDEPWIEAHARQLASVISAHLERPFDEPLPTESAHDQPPGSPIGSPAIEWLDPCSSSR